MAKGKRLFSEAGLSCFEPVHERWLFKASISMFEANALRGYIVFQRAAHAFHVLQSWKPPIPRTRGPTARMLDFTTILALVVAIVVFMQLRNVLGKRTGNERPPFDPYVRRESSTPPPTEGERDGDERVVTLPRREEDDPYREIDRVAPKSSELNRGLRAVQDASREVGFEPREFLDGAKRAYEMIVNAYAEGDRDTLRSLLAPDVYEGFAAAIDAREEDGLSVRHSFVGIEEAVIESAAVRDGEAFVAVRLVSQVIQATVNKDGDVVDGDPDTVSEVRDVWTFAREANSPDPNWLLVATEAEE